MILKANIFFQSREQAFCMQTQHNHLHNDAIVIFTLPQTVRLDNEHDTLKPFIMLSNKQILL